MVMAMHQRASMTTTMAMNTEGQALLHLLTFLSPAFPTGAFAYSHGLEQAIASGVITGEDDLADWIESLLVRGSAFNDAVLIASATEDNLAELNALALSLSASRERHLESTALGASFAASAGSFLDLGLPEGEVAYPLAVAAAGTAAGIDRTALVPAYLHAFAANLVSVAVRLVPIGQRAGLSVLARLLPVIEAVSGQACAAGPDALGSACLFSDIASMRHEFQEPRIFRT